MWSPMRTAHCGEDRLQSSSILLVRKLHFTFSYWNALGNLALSLPDFWLMDKFVTLFHFLLQSLGLGQTNLRIPQGTVGQVMLDDRAYLVRWEYSYSSWTLFTCEIEMLLHVVSTAGEGGWDCKRINNINWCQFEFSSRTEQLWVLLKERGILSQKHGDDDYYYSVKFTAKGQEHVVKWDTF